MADKESFAKYLDIDIESAKKFYESSSTLLDSLKDFDSTIDTYIDDFIAFNNAKVSSQPAINKSIALANGFKKIDKADIVFPGINFDCEEVICFFWLSIVILLNKNFQAWYNDIGW